MNAELAITEGREALLDEVVTRYLKAIEMGARPDPDEWLSRHSELRDELIAFFADQQRIERIAAPLRAIAPPNGTETVAYRGSEPPPDPTGNVPALDEYEMLEEVGRGGMGVVYKARQRSLNRVVALKMILAGPFASRTDVARFRSEAEAAASLDHPHIVPVYGSGETGGQPYFTMKFVEGTNLARTPPTTPRTLAELLVLVARAVHYAHQRGILHRDLKPSNILLGTDGRPHVTDFGLARRIESAATLSGRIVGTPVYMAPEQAAGAKHLTTAVDVYGLGAVLYEGLTGQPPFQGETMLAVLDQVRGREPVPPRSVRRNIPRDLETICLKCLHKDPSRRYPSADALADDLDRFLAGGPVLARRTGPLERVAKWTRRRPALAALSVAVVALIGTVIGLLSMRLEQAVAGLGEAAEREEKLKVVADERDRTAKLVEATLCFEKGSTRLQQGDTASGLLWLTRGLEQAPEDAKDLRSGIRRQLGAGVQQIHPVRAAYALGDPGTQVARLTAFTPDGKVIVIASSNPQNASPRLWLRDAASGQLNGDGHEFQFGIEFIAFHPNSKEVVVGSGSFLRRIDTITGKAIGNAIEVKPSPLGQGPTPALSWPRVGGFLAGGKVFYTFGADGVIRVFSTGDWGKPAEYTALPSTQPPIFSPDGKRFLLLALDSITIWETATWQLSQEQLALKLDGGESIQRAIWSSDAKTILVAIASRVSLGEETARIEYWVPGMKRGPIGKPLPHGKQDSIDFIATSPKGSRVHTKTYSGDWRVWDAETDRLLRETKFAQNIRPAFSPDGGVILAGANNGSGRLYYANTLTPLGPPLCDQVGSIAFSPDGRSLLVGCQDGTARLYDLRVPWKTAVRSSTYILAPSVVGFTDDNRTSFLLSDENKGVSDDARVMGPLFEALVKQEYPLPLNLSPGNRFLLTMRWTGPLGQRYHVHDVRSGKVTGEFEVGELPYPSLHALSPDGKTLFAAVFNDKKPGDEIRRWDVVTGKPLGEPLGADGNILALGFTPDRKIALVMETTRDGTFQPRVWRSDLATGKRCGGVVELVRSWPNAAVFAPDAKSVLVYSDIVGLRVWDVETGKPKGEPLLPPSGRRVDVHYSPDGRTLAAIKFSEDHRGREVHLWDAATLKPLGAAIAIDINAGGAGSKKAFAFSPDGKRFAAVVGGKLTVFDVPQPLEGDAERVRLWVEVNTGKELDTGGALIDIVGDEWLKRWERLQKPGGPLP
jgi:WD40 repeat protein/predicted Ser/Thr protein kinase